MLLQEIIKNDTDFATYLLEETGVAIVQGSAFGLEEGDALLISVNNTAITGIVSIMEVNRGSLTN